MLYDYKFGSKKEFVKAVASAYSHFMVIKALETLAQDRIAGPLLSPPAVASSECASMGWYTIQHRRPGTWDPDQPTSETADDGAELQVEATHVANPCEPLDVSADELEGWVSICCDGD